MSTVLVFGAGRPGIGQAVTRRFLADGCRVVGTVDDEYASDLPENLFGDSSDVTIQQINHADPEAVSSVISSVDAIAGLVIAEFYFNMEDPNKFDIEKWQKSLSVNLTLPKLAYHLAVRKVEPGGFMTVITSTEGFIGSFGAHGYAATKAAVHNLVKSLANIANGSIRVNAVAAGWIGGVMDTDEVFNMSRKITPLGRLGEADEVAAAVAFLGSKDASFVNGTVLVADGGYSGVDTIAKFEFESEYGSIKG